MGLDIRRPLGLLFLAIGGLLAGYGILTWGKPMYAMSLGVNINAIWGFVLLIFGGVMYWLGRVKVVGRRLP